jgi:hypothetical protein
MPLELLEPVEHRGEPCGPGEPGAFRSSRPGARAKRPAVREGRRAPHPGLFGVRARSIRRPTMGLEVCRGYAIAVDRKVDRHIAPAVCNGRVPGAWRSGIEFTENRMRNACHGPPRFSLPSGLGNQRRTSDRAERGRMVVHCISWLFSTASSVLARGGGSKA